MRGKTREREALRDRRPGAERLGKGYADDAIAPVERDGLVVIVRDIDRPTRVVEDLRALVLVVKNVLPGVRREPKRSTVRQQETRAELGVLKMVRKIVVAANPLDDFVGIRAASRHVPRQ